MTRKLLKYTVSVAVLAAMFQTTPAFATPANTPVTQGQIDATKEQIDDIETKIQQLDDKIIMAMEKSEKLNGEINIQQEKIAETEVEIDKAKKDFEVHKTIYSERLKSMQAEGKQSIVTYAELLFSSTNISEFLTRFTAISKIIESDTDLLKGLNEKEQALKDAEEKLHIELDSLKKNQEELASEQKQIEEAKQEVARELAAAQERLESQEEQLAQQKEDERQAELARQAEIARQQAQQQAQPQVQQRTSVKDDSTSFTDTSNLSNSEKVNQLIAYAKQFQGVPYVWGGSTPSGFDCSGFTSYVYRHVGISLPRVSRDQQRVGTRISVDQVQPGDLVFRGNPAHHVGIYIGNGQYIHAPQTGDVVKIAPYNPAKFTTASRVLP